MSGLQLRFGDDGEFKALLMERWEKEGKNPASFDKKIWRWLSGERPVQSSAERRYMNVIKNWAFHRTSNDVIYRRRKAAGYYDRPYSERIAAHG